MYMCASTFGWTPDQVKQLSIEELEALFLAGKKLSKVAPSGSGPPEKPLSSISDVERFIKQQGAR